MKELIPVMHCFDNNYVIPAAVSFYSMLLNADKTKRYKLLVLHDNITEANQKRLAELVSRFNNASIDFIDTKGKFSDLYNALPGTAFSKEIFYKFLPPVLFPEYDKIIITDVDVIFCGDISVEYNRFDIYGNDKKCYLAGNARHFETYKLDGETDSRYQREVLAGYWIFNLNKMREDNMYEKFVDYAWKNVKTLRNPEQEVVNYCCYPDIKILPPNTIVSALSYGMNLYENDEFLNSLFQTAKKNPLQIHFSESRGKAWNKVNTPKWYLWLTYLKETSFFEDYILNMQRAIELYDASKKIISIKIPFRERRLSVFWTGLKAVRKTKMLRTK